MTKVISSASMSVDGFIAGPRGDMSWLAAFMGPSAAAEALVARTGSMLVGRRTYGGDDPAAGTPGEGEAFGGGWSGEQFVLTHRPEPTAPPGTTFVADLETGLRLALESAGDKDVNVLGADVARQLIERGELDEIVLLIVPVLLGDGTRLLDVAGGLRTRLETISTSQEGEVTTLQLRVVRP